MRWTWFDESKGECWPDVFSTPDAAMGAMADRFGHPVTLEEMARINLYLATVEVIVKPTAILRLAKK